MVVVGGREIHFVTTVRTTMNLIGFCFIVTYTISEKWNISRQRAQNKIAISDTSLRFIFFPHRSNRYIRNTYHRCRWTLRHEGIFFFHSERKKKVPGPRNDITMLYNRKNFTLETFGLDKNRDNNISWRTKRDVCTSATDEIVRRIACQVKTLPNELRV